jgi:hypothetical protein
MMMKIGFTGTREGMSEAQKDALKVLLKKYAMRTKYVGTHEFHHGGCEGADLEAGEIARKLHYRVVIHPGGNTVVPKGIKAEVLPQRPNLRRNQDIVDVADMMIAAPRTDKEEQRSGTWATIRYAGRRLKALRLLAR